MEEARHVCPQGLLELEQYHLGDVLDRYCYDYHKFSENIARLLDYAGAFEKSFVDCQLSDFTFQGEENIRDFSEKLKSRDDRVSAILNELYFSNFTDAHNYFVRITQQLFYNRSGERWDAYIPAWIQDHLQEVTDILKDMGSCNSILPQKNEYDCVAVFGANSDEMDKRLRFMHFQRDNPVQYKHIFLLTGERYVEYVDSPHAIEAAMHKFNITQSNVKEAHLMQVIHEGYAFSDNKDDLPFYVIDSKPRGDRSRPTTRDTIEDFMADDNYHKCNSVLYVSRSPNIYAQGEDVLKLMPKSSNGINDEVIGGECTFDESLPLNVAYHIIMPIAGSLYGGWERVEESATGQSLKQNKFVKPSENCPIATLDSTLGIY